MRVPKMRTVIREHVFDADYNALRSSVQRTREFVEGAENVLSRQPDSGYRLAERSNVWFFAGHGLVLYYCFDDDNVIFLSRQKSQVISDQGS